MASGMKMFEDVRPWLQVCCESDDLLAIGRIPYSITEIGFCLGLDYRDIYGIDHNYRQHYEKTLQLLTLWKNKNGSNATLWNLIVCLQKLGDGQLLEEFQTAIQKRYADSLCPSSGPGVEVMDYYVSETAKLYQQQSSKQMSTITLLSHPSDECYDSPSPSPLGYSSLSSADSMGSGLASLLASDFAVSHPSSCPKSNDSTCSRKSEYFTPPCSIEDESGSGTDNNHKVDDDMKQAPAEHFEPPQWNRHLLDRNLQEELKHKTQQVRHLREQYHREKSKVCALKKKLAQVCSYACKQRREKEELRCKLDECEHKTDTLMMEIFRRGIERDTGSCLQAQLKLLEQEKTSLQEGLLQLQTNYTQVVQDSRWLRLQQQQEHMRLECQVAELSMENRELQAHNMELERQCAALTSPTSWYPRMRETQGVVFHRRSRRDSALGVRRCRSDHDVYLSGVSASMEEQCTETSTHSEQQMISQCDDEQ